MEETKSNPELFDVVILDEYNTREEALRAEYNYQKMHNVVHSDNYINMALASPTGFFGRDTSGENHPLYGSNNCQGYKHYYHPDTLERRFCVECPIGFVVGRYNEKCDTNSGRKSFYNTHTGEYKFVKIKPHGDEWVTKGKESKLKGKTGSRKGKMNARTKLCPIRNEPFRSKLKLIWDEIGRCGSVNLIRECHLRGHHFVKSRTLIDNIIREFRNE